MSPAGALLSASQIASVNSWCAEHVNRITHGQHHEPVTPAFLHFEAVVGVRSGRSGLVRRNDRSLWNLSLIIPRMIMAVGPSESRRHVRGSRSSRAVARADPSQHP